MSAKTSPGAATNDSHRSTCVEDVDLEAISDKMGNLQDSGGNADTRAQSHLWNTKLSEANATQPFGAKEEVLSLESIDPALNKKLHLVNDAIDQIGFTPYHWKLLFLNGFGYAVDSLLLILQSIVQPQIAKEIPTNFPAPLTIALYIGLLLGALFWGFTADLIGRKWAFNISLLSCSIFAIIAGWSESYPVLGCFVALSAFGAGGNLILDTTVFLEFLPSSKQWLLTLLAGWWGVGQTTAGLVSWPFMANYSCETAANCTRSNNMGWRYVWWTLGGFIFVLSMMRIFVIRLTETPKYLLSSRRDAELVEVLQSLAMKYNRSCSLTLQQLEACGEIANGTRTTHEKKLVAQFNTKEIMLHVKGLFVTKKIGISTGLIWLSWALIGLAYPLYSVFLPEYLASRGAKFGSGSVSQTYKDYAIANTCGIFGPILAGFLCEVPRLGRRGAMAIGALITMIFLFAYTNVRSESQNLAFTCLIYFWLNAYYGTLYAYTPEVLPSAHRATGNGIAVSFNRIMGIFAGLVAAYANTATSAPIYICASLYVVLALIALVLPFEPYGRRSA